MGRVFIRSNSRNINMKKYILEIIYHYSTALTSWSWQKLYGDRKKGAGYNNDR